MADQPIDKIYIDIEVKNTGLNTLKTATKNLQEIVTNVNMKGIDIGVTSNTLNTITYLSNLARQLGNVQRALSRPLILDVQKIETTKIKGSGKQRKTGDTISTSYDITGKSIGQTISEVSKDGFKTTIQTNAFGQELKKVEEYVNSAGEAFKDIYKNTIDLEKGITKNTYALDKNGKEWLQTSVTQKQTKDGLLKITTTYNELGKEISKVSTLTDQFGNVTTKTSGDLKKSKVSLNSFGNSIVSAAAKFTILGYGISQLSNLFSTFIQKSNAYIENLNLFQVTFGNMADEAQRFAETYSEALGLDVSQTLRDMAVFNQIVTGFGVTREEGYQMSKLLTQLSYDLSSFMNIPFEDAVLKFQSGIAGELEPLRRVGYALDEATLQQVAYNNGITESIRTMTQQEKAYIRLLAMYEQSENVMGDLAGTIDSPANALRILEQQFTQLQRAIGNAIVPIITKLIPIIQGATKALTEFFNMIAERLGYEVEGTRENAYADYMDNITTSAEEAENAIKGTLLSFDKFSVLGSEKNSNENFVLPIPDYDALATLTDSLVDTSESFKKTYEIFSSILMNDTKDDLAAPLKAILDLVNSIWSAISVGWNKFIQPVLIPALTDSIKVLINIFEKLVNALQSTGLLQFVTTMYILLKVVSGLSGTFKIFLPIINVFGSTIISLGKNIIALFSTTLPLILEKFKIILISVFGSLQGAFIQLTGGLATVVALFYSINSVINNWSNMNTFQKIASIIGIVTTAFFGLALAIGAFQSAWSVGLAVAGIIAGIVAVTASVNSAKSVASQPVQAFESGGFTPKTSGSLFIAGENGKPELMGAVGGKNAVANVNSIETAMEQASYKGMVMAINQANQNNTDNKDIVLQIDGKELARVNVKNTAIALNRNYKIELNPR